MTALLVAAGAAVGAPLRFVVGRLLDKRGSWPLHWGTLLVNLAGSLVLGALAASAASAHAVALLGTGFCGGLTTYSAFAVQTSEAGPRRGILYAVATVGGCLLAAWVGHLLATR